MSEQEIFRNYGYILDLQGVRAGYFTSIRSQGLKIGTIDYREGGTPNVVRKLPGQTVVSPIICEWGVTNNSEMWDWLMKAATGVVERKEVSVIILGTDGVTEKVRWNYSNVWPCEWRGAEMAAGGNDIAIESMVLQAESVERG